MPQDNSKSPKLTADRTGTTSRMYGNTVRRKVGLPRGVKMHMRVTSSALARLGQATWEEIDNGQGDIYWELRRPGQKCVVYPTWRAACEAATATVSEPQRAPHERYETRLVPVAPPPVAAVASQREAALTLIQIGVAMLKAGEGQ